MAFLLALALSLLPPAQDRHPALLDVAALRAEGPAALERLCDRRDALEPGVEKDALERAIDAVAAQRYAAWSRLYWYTDLELARTAAQAAGKPILSLRMLGRLDEDLSSEDSRFFRAVLYADPAVSSFLRESFVLHWSSERPVPRITIDFGDGRRIETTAPGHSAHYVLDAGGRVLDVLPGLYSPEAFLRELEAALPLARWSPRILESERLDVVKAYHVERLEAAARLWSGPRRLDEVRLSPASRALLARLGPVDWARAPRPLAGKALERAFRDLEVLVAADTERNERDLRAAVHRWYATFALLPEFESLNDLVYRELFATPRDDPWVGFARPGTITGLPRDGIVE